MENELEKLIREKQELERRIAMLIEGKIIMDTVKLDTIKHNAGNSGRWAVSYKYKHISEWGWNREPKESTKWVPMFSCENREEAIKMIPKVIEELQELYARAIKKVD